MLIRYKVPHVGGLNEITFDSGAAARVWAFNRNDAGDYVCDVTDEGDARQLLSIAEGFEDAAAATVKAAPVAPPPDRAAFLDELDLPGMSLYAASIPVKLDKTYNETQVRTYLRGLLAARG